MADVIVHSTQYMTAEDLAAIATYLKSLSPAPSEGRATFAASDSTMRTIIAGNEKSPGGFSWIAAPPAIASREAVKRRPFRDLPTIQAC